MDLKKTYLMKSINEEYPRRSAGERILTKALEDEFLRFVHYHPASRFSRNLRKMLLEFLMAPGADEGLYVKDLLYDLDGLFELLDAIQAEDDDEN